MLYLHIKKLKRTDNKKRNLCFRGYARGYVRHFIRSPHFSPVHLKVIRQLHIKRYRQAKYIIVLIDNSVIFPVLLTHLQF